MRISYAGHVVEISERNVASEDFNDRVNMAYKILSYFSAKNRNVWGTDGVGYAINKSHGLVEVRLSTVGPRQYKQGLAVVKDSFAGLEYE